MNENLKWPLIGSFYLLISRLFMVIGWLNVVTKIAEKLKFDFV